MENELEEDIHGTPLATRTTVWDDSGYLTNTPDSADSVRFLNRFSQATGQVPFMRFTPGSSNYKSVEYIPFNRNKPFPISSEDSEDIVVLEEPVLKWRSHEIGVDDADSEMCIDAADCSKEDGIYSPDISDRSLYDSIQLEHCNIFEKASEDYKHCGMEIDEDILQLPHPNSENEDWNELDDEHPENCVEEIFTPNVSLQTPSGQNLLVQKLQDLKTFQRKKTKLEDKFGMLSRPITTWRQKLKKGGCRYAEDFSGKSTVDFLLYLGVFSDHSSVISNILSYLSPLDLKACTYVSKDWRKVCSNDKNSALRLEQYKQQTSYVNKENSTKSKLQAGVQFGPLVTISNFHHTRVSPPATPMVSPSKVRSREFVDALNKGGVMFMQCPKCHCPAKINKAIFEAQCDKQNCLYLFCTNCRYQAHRPKPCVTVSGRKPRKRGASTVGSKESRKNLRRLL